MSLKYWLVLALAQSFIVAACTQDAPEEPSPSSPDLGHVQDQGSTLDHGSIARDLGELDMDIVDLSQDLGSSQPNPCAPALAAVGAYADDASIIATLEGLGAGQGVMLPGPTIENQGFTGYDSHKGPPARDFSNRMVFVPERLTALYAGGSHGTYRANDVWEYHLGSNTWTMLFYPDGGNVGPHKAAIFGLNAWFAEGKTPDAELMTKIEDFKSWAKQHLRFEGGRLFTTNGGPLMPSHQWDGMTYDYALKRLVWRSGAHSHLEPGAIAYLFDLDVDEVKAQLDPQVTPMWRFDPAQAKWSVYTHDNASPRSELRGMGASATYVPELCGVVHYAAAQNVVPAVFEMWLHKSDEDTWHRLAPNQGRALRELVLTDKLAPSSEQQIAYSPRHQKLVAVLEQDTFVYDLAQDQWSLANTDPRHRANDSRTIFVYDTKNDVFLLFDMDKPATVFAFSLTTLQWEEVAVQGQPFSPPPYNRPFGYYDPRHNALVVGNARNRGIWVFRYR